MSPDTENRPSSPTDSGKTPSMSGGGAGKSSPARPRNAPMGANGGSGVSGSLHRPAGNRVRKYSMRARTRPRDTGQDYDDIDISGSVGGAGRNGFRPRAPLPSTGNNSDRILNPDELNPPSDDEPKNMTPGTHDPNNPDADPYNTIGNQYDNEFDPTRSDKADGEDADEDGEKKNDKDPGEKDLADKEDDAKSGDDSGMSQAEKDRFGDDTLGKGYNGDHSKGRGQKKRFSNATLWGRIGNSVGGRRAAVGGGILGIILTIAVGGFTSIANLQLQHGAEALENAGSAARVQNLRSKSRQARSFIKIMRDISKDPKSALRFDRPKLANKLKKAGFQAEFDEATGLLRNLRARFTSSGTTVDRAIELTGSSSKAVADDVLGDATGKIILNSIDETGSSAVTKLSRGIQARAYLSAIRARLLPWLRIKPDAPENKDLTDRQKFASDLRAKDSADFQKPTKAGNLLKEGDNDGNGVVDDADKGATSQADEISEEFSKQIEEYAEQLKDPRVGDEATGVVGKGGSEALESEFDELGEALGGALDNNLDEMQEIAGKIAAKSPSTVVKSALQGAALGVGVLGIPQTACRVRGALNFILNVRNLLVAVELSRFFVKYMTAANSQKAGLANAEGIKIFMLYLNTPNPSTGRTAFQSGGMQQLFGNTGAAINPHNMSKFNVGRVNEGFLGKVNNILDSIPLINNGGFCKFVNNGFVVVGSIAIGALLTIFGGELTGIPQANIGVSIFLTLLKEAVFLFGVPLAIKAGSHHLFQGYEHGEYAGDGLAAGRGSFKAGNGGKNGFRLTKKSKFALYEKQALDDYKYQLAQKSLFDRYLNIKDSNSMVARMTLRMPVTYSSTVTTIGWSGASLINTIFSPTSILSGLFGVSKAHAAANECQDPKFKELDIAADSFCNPIVVETPDIDNDENETFLRSINQIDADGKPTGKEFLDYIKDCHSGEGNLLYGGFDTSQNGNDPPVKTTCLEDGEPLTGDPINIGRNIRFAAWYGYYVDRENTIEDVNDSFQVVGAGQVQQNTGQVATTTGCPTQPAPASQTVESAGFTVHTCIQKNVADMVAAAAAEGMTLTGSGWRDTNDQIALRQQHCGPTDYDIYERPSGECSPPTAIPGRSQHEYGLALDLRCNGVGSYAFADTQCMTWLQANAARFGFKNLPSEPWHWSTTGT